MIKGTVRRQTDFNPAGPDLKAGSVAPGRAVKRAQLAPSGGLFLGGRGAGQADALSIMGRGDRLDSSGAKKGPEQVAGAMHKAQ